MLIAQIRYSDPATGKARKAADRVLVVDDADGHAVSSKTPYDAEPLIVTPYDNGTDNPDDNGTDNPDDVVDNTTSDKPLPNTGGVPLLGLGVLGSICVFTAFALLRPVIRRNS